MSKHSFSLSITDTVCVVIVAQILATDDVIAVSKHPW